MAATPNAQIVINISLKSGTLSEVKVESPYKYVHEVTSDTVALAKKLEISALHEADRVLRLSRLLGLRPVDPSTPESPQAAERAKQAGQAPSAAEKENHERTI
jgi:hypothetical protein